jgi:hypothetical protein
MSTMIPEAPRKIRLQHVTTTGWALASALLPLVAGVLLAKTMAADPLTPVNAMITQRGQRVRISPSQWRSCGQDALRRGKAAAAQVGNAPGGRHAESHTWRCRMSRPRSVPRTALGCFCGCTAGRPPGPPIH